MPETRYRFRDTRVQSSIRQVDYDPNGNLQTDSSYSDVRKARGSFKSITDVRDPEYFAKKRRGEVVLHPVLIVTDDRETGTTSNEAGPHPGWGRRVITGDVAAMSNQAPSGAEVTQFWADVDTAKDLALIEAYAKMNQPDVLFSVFYAERGKTAAMLRRPFGKARDLTEQIFARKARLISRGYTAARALAQAWLEYRYGWRPTMMDIAGIAKAAGHKKPTVGQLLVQRGGKHLDRTINGSATTPFPGLTSLDLEYRWQFDANVNAGVCYRYRDLSEIEWRRRCLGLTLDQVPSHLWEVTPYSFVVDYFIKVGAWLQAITPNPDVIVEGNWVSAKTMNVNTNSVTRMLTHVTQNPVTDYYGSGGHYTEKLGRFERSVNSSLPTVPPMEVNSLSFAHSVDIAALLLGRIHGGLGRLRI